MQEFGIGRGGEARGVDLDLGDAVTGDGGQRGLRSRIGRKSDVARAAGGGRSLRGQREAALGLARMRDAQRQIHGERRGELEQPRRVARVELDLDLGDRRATPAGTNLAYVDAERGTGAIGERERLLGAAHLGGEDSPVCAAVPREELVPRRAGKLLRIETWRGEGPLEFGTAVQTRHGVSVALDGLQPAAPRAAQAQRDACGGEGVVRRIVVGADHARGFHASACDRGDRRMRSHRGQHLRGSGQLELDFFAHRSALQDRGVRGPGFSSRRSGAPGADAPRRPARAARPPLRPSRRTRQ